MTKFTEWISTKYNSVNLEKIPSIPSKPSPAFLLKNPVNFVKISRAKKEDK